MISDNILFIDFLISILRALINKILFLNTIHKIKFQVTFSKLHIK